LKKKKRRYCALGPVKKKTATLKKEKKKGEEVPFSDVVEKESMQAR